ncbi:MAG: phosphotransferase [Rhodobacteraceae bacterium]|nr:phosphotransferase [Paracoccaceae bacterium]
MSAIDRLVNQSLQLWPLPAPATARLINVSENRTYLVQTPGIRRVLRLHRPGYNSIQEIESELDWMQALANFGAVNLPAIYPGRDGKRVQSLPGNHHAMVLFEFIDGTPPSPSGPIEPLFKQLGELSARMHNHTLQWQPPPGFQRFHWDLDAVFGPSPRWGDWQSAPGITNAIKPILERLTNTLCQRLTSYGQANDRYGLIHADMRLANLILNNEKPSVIDFDDCGYSWFTYDFAAAISFMEDDPRIPALKHAWLSGYGSERSLSPADIQEMDTLIMLRRMALLAWLGSHPDTSEAAALATAFAPTTAKLAETYLGKFA